MNLINNGCNTRRMRQHIGASMLPFDPALNRLIAASNNAAGLGLLLLLSHDPETFDTVEGFAARLQYPLGDVRAALESLHAVGVLKSYVGPGDNVHCISYWLSDDENVLRTLRRLNALYRSSPQVRQGILCTLEAYQ